MTNPNESTLLAAANRLAAIASIIESHGADSKMLRPVAGLLYSVATDPDVDPNGQTAHATLTLAETVLAQVGSAV